MKPKIAAYALRLPLPLKEQAERLAAGQGSSLNQFIVTAVAEKVSSLGGAGAASGQRLGAAAGASGMGVEDDDVSRGGV
ncbi:YlcI/YnfO family protein [Methylocystis bryophila]|nr:YlcI/YnfO family protein [Methylocystis bryophila]BDV39928.1 hypothetical protein DSM21852_31810 [Methylocystis bryophila]